MISFVYFDIGGVLNKYDKVFTDAPSKFGVDREKFGDLFDKYDEELTRGKFDVNDFWKLCVKELEIKGGENFNMGQSWANDFEIIQENFNLVLETKKKCQVGILSNHYRGVFDVVYQWQAFLYDQNDYNRSSLKLGEYGL